MTTTNSAWCGTIAAHLQTAKAEKDGHKDGVYAPFTKPGFAYASFPLRASPKQIREAKHTMLLPDYCYLRLFAVKSRRQIIAMLGQTPPSLVFSNCSA